MDEVRIKDLTSAAGQMDEFDKFEFIVDVPAAEASMKVSGKEIKGVMAPKRHTQAVGDVTGLSGELEKKLDKKGGTLTGDLSVMGDTYLRRLHLEEFLEVPEYRYNRIETVVGDKWSAPGGGIVELVSTADCTLVLKLEEGEVGTVRENDLCMGIFQFQYKGIVIRRYHLDNAAARCRPLVAHDGLDAVVTVFGNFQELL